MPFSDDDLDAFYREIESRTAASPERRSARRKVPVVPAREVCPTPMKQSFSAESLARDAIDAADRSAAVHQRRTARLRTYQCVCGAWHLTSSPAR